MHFYNFLFLALGLASTAFSLIVDKRQTSVDSWISQEEPIARSGLFRNIGNRGDFAKSVNAGAVIASPSTSSPDYFFQWTRDSAMVFKILLNTYIKGNTSIETFLKEYATESDRLQRQSNPSGGYQNSGIGEPKFLVNGAPFTGGWGRPQNDGPAIRATVLIKFANMLLDAGQSSYVTSALYNSAFPANSIIKADLEYVSHYWTVNGFDLWEEVTGQHFFNYMVQQRALIEGAELATRLGDSGAADYYNQQAAAIKAKLPSFWDSGRGHLVSTLNTGRNGLDCGTLLGSLHGNGARGFGIYSASSDQVLVTLQRLVDIMTPLYPINGQPGAPGIAIGRYSADVYDGVGTSVAHPWFICTFTVAETLYTALSEFSKKGGITVSLLSQSFYRKFYPSAAAGITYASGSAGYVAITTGIKAYADSFVAVGQAHVTVDGSLSEQFSRYDGFQRGARDLTWSYASFLTMRWARAGTIAY